MSDEQQPQEPAAEGTPPKATEAAATPAWTPPASQAELDRIISERVARAKAQFSDYGDLKQKASKFDEITEAQKTELQKAVERAEAAEKRAQEFEAAQQISAWKAEAAKASGVPADVLRGSTEQEIQAHAETLKSLIPAPDAKRGAVGPYVPAEGGTPSTPLGGDPASQFAELLRKARGK
jgi:hypothetical protein